MTAVQVACGLAGCTGIGNPEVRMRLRDDLFSNAHFGNFQYFR